jgi:hypothetical protein
MNIYIMTRGRVGRQHTWNALPDRIREKTYLVVPDGEGNAHVESGIPLRNILFAPSWVKNYSDKFKYLVELDDGYEKAVIIDDDLKFSVPYINPETGRRLQTVKDQDMQIAVGFDYMEMLLDDTALVSFHPRQMGHTKEPPYAENGKVVCVQGINRRLVGTIPDLNRFPILADVVLNATLLSRGLGNKIITTLFIDWYPCQAPGGCSETRTAEMQAEACYWLEERFGPYIKAVEKEAKSGWLGGKRVDFRGQWKKLYAAGASGVLDTRT